MKTLIALALAGGLAGFLSARPATAQTTVVYDFDSGPQYAGLPLDLTVNGLTAHFTGGYSIQAANVYGFTPAGFAGLCLCPSSVYQSDLGVSFSALITDFSVLYAVDELACDSSATMRVTAYDNGVFVGTATMVAQPGTYPSAILDIAVPSGFNSVVVHWDHAGVGCSDYGPIFFADNVTAVWMPPVGVGPGDPSAAPARLLAPAPSPFRDQTAIRYELRTAGEVRLGVYDLAGRLVRSLVSESVTAGPHRASWDGRDDAGRRMPAGVYHVRLEAAGLRQAHKVLFVP